MKSLMTLVLWILLSCLAVDLSGWPVRAQNLDDDTRLILRARSLARIKKYAEALDAFQFTVAAAERSGNSLIAALALNNMAEIHVLQNNAPAALNAARRALTLFGELGNRRGIELSRKLMESIAPGSSETVDIPDRSRAERIEQAIERIRNRVRGQAKEIPQIAATQDAGYQEYLAKIKNAIVNAWHDPEIAGSTREEGKVGVQFTVLGDGTVDDLRILRPSNFLPLNIEAMRAIRSAAPFPPIPERFGLKRIQIEFTFNYLLQSSSEGTGQNR